MCPKCGWPYYGFTFNDLDADRGVKYWLCSKCGYKETEIV